MKFFIVYGGGVVFVLVLLWFIWAQLMSAPSTPTPPVPAATTTDIAATASDTSPSSTAATSSQNQATGTKQRIEGVFLSLQEMEAQWRTGHTYLLVDDGTEIFRIDLRPLLGNATNNVAEKLGITRGQRIEVYGVVNEEGVFRVQSIDPVSPTSTESVNAE